MINSADTTYINMAQLQDDLKVEVCQNNKATSLASIRHGDGPFSADCRLRGYAFNARCTEILVSSKSVDCYYYGSLRQSLNSRFSRDDVLQMALKIFNGDNCIPLASLVRGSASDCSDVGRKISVEKFDSLYMASWPNGNQKGVAGSTSAGTRN